MEGINKNISMKYVCNKMKILRNRECVVNWNEWEDRNRGEEVKKEMEKIGRDWVREEEVIIPDDEIMEKENMELSRELKELDRVIKEVRTKSVPGNDGINYGMIKLWNYGMIKELPIEFKREILDMYNIF